MNLLSEISPQGGNFVPDQPGLPGVIDYVQDKAAALLTAPEFLRSASFALRRLRPTLVVAEFATVTRFADVVEVLENETFFRVVPVYAQAMLQTTGAFILGMDDRTRYEHEATFLRSAVRTGDLEYLRELVASRANELIAAARGRGELDVASGYAHEIALTVASQYFGVPGPDKGSMSRWMRTIFWDLFLNLTKRTSVTELARSAAAELNAYLERLVSELRVRLARDEDVPDDFLSRLVRAQGRFQIDDEGVRRNIGGLVVGAVETLSKAIVHAIDQLLRRPTVFAQASAAALSGQTERVAAYAFEALRFNPHNPIIVRYCAEDFRLARGTTREAVIRAGTTTFASTLSGMFDASVLPSPHEFRIDRPWEHYLHFGRGMHRCFGERLNRVIIPQAVQALLASQNLARLHGDAGRIHYEGPFPSQLLVKI
ncbi:MAG TPA: cytochrome P450 [Polyangiaceae bacterium]|nr:cytochrome P450 [Polyangiaceae bacterium]